MIYALIAIVILVIGALLYGAYFMSSTVCKPKVYDKEHEVSMLSSWGFDYNAFIAEVEQNGKEDFEFQSPMGYTLRGFIAKSKNAQAFKDGRTRVIVLCHGYTNNSVSVASYASIYYNLGFTLAFYDHRCHGNSDKNSFCSMSHYEAKDLCSLVEYLKPRFKEDTIWGLHGESMGSATVMTAAPNIKGLSFVVEDCGFTTMHEEMKASLKFKFNLPPFPLVLLGNMFVFLRFGFKVKDVRPIDHVKDITCPMLFVHGSKDRFVPTAMVYELYEQKPKDKKLFIFEDCTHAKSVLGKREQYSQVVKDFLTEFNIIGDQI